MKREAPAWRAPSEYDRPSEAPRGRERPGQRYVLKMRGVPFRAAENDVYEVGSVLVGLRTVGGEIQEDKAMRQLDMDLNWTGDGTSTGEYGSQLCIIQSISVL